jgi:hypothetical protein
MIERLRTDFAGVIDAHQRRGIAPVAFVEPAFLQIAAGHRANRRGPRTQSAQCTIEIDYQSLDARHEIIFCAA